ncbi:MAG: PAS domain S-box protein [Bacteroidetes bacterium]|nr:PAS domain S-box protein [Bacteroidota bacterium]MBU1113908.1 PAS domain S-box protein [Bacteroidota bacterium]MBU1798227.1 PAS domain S-box protein [Bacteroidota bacterium]
MSSGKILPNEIENRISNVLERLAKEDVSKQEIVDLLQTIQKQESTNISHGNVRTNELNNFFVGQGKVKNTSEKDNIDGILNEREDNYRGIFNSVSDSIYILDKNGIFIDVNIGAEKMYDYTKEQLIGKTPAFVGAPDKNDLDKNAEYLTAAYNGENQEFKFWGLRKNGDVFPKIVRLYPGEFDGEKVVIALGQDISERINSENQIKESNERFKNLIQFAPDPFFQGDEIGNFIECNKAACQLTEYTREELLTLNMKDLFSSKMLEEKPLRFDLLQNGKTIRSERELVTKSGKIIFVEMNSSRMSNGTYQSFVRDITERKHSERTLRESEERFKKIAFNFKQSYYEADKRGVITHTNEEFNIVSGYTGNDLIGKISFLIVDKEFRNAVVSKYKKCIQEKSAYTTSEFKVNLRNNKNSWVEQFTHFHYSEDGTFIKTTNVVKDISERKEAEEVIRLSEKNFRLLFENSPLGTYIAKPNGEIIDANSALLKILGTPSIEAAKQINVLTFPPLVNNGYAKLFNECVANNKTLTLELEYNSNMGKKIMLSSYIIPLANEKGEVEKIYTIMEDISKRKWAEASLRESEELFRNLSTSTATAIFIYQNENFVFANEATEMLTGYSKDELLAMKFWEVVQPDYRDLVRKRGLERQSGKAIPNRDQFKLQKKDGSETWIDFTGGKISWDGKQAGLGTANDITSLKIAEEKLRQSEAKYKIFSDLSSDYIYTAKLPKVGNSVIDWVGGSFEKIIGYTFEEFIENGGWQAIVHPEDLTKDLNAHSLLKENKKTKIEIRIFNKKKEIVWVRSIAYPIWDEVTNCVKSIYGAVKDITEEKNAELALKESRERYKLISGLTSDYLFSVKIDENGNSISNWVGGSFEEMTGYTFEEYKKLGGWRTTLHADDLETDSEAFNKLLNNEKAIIEVRTIHKNGHIVWVESFGSPVWDYKNNKLIGINGAVKNITKEKEALLALQEREEKYKLISTITSDYLFESKLDENKIPQVIWVAGSFKKMTGYDLDEYKKIGGWNTLLHKDDIEIDKLALNKLNQNKKATVELRTYNKDGNIVWVKNTCSPIWDYNNNKLKGVIGSVKDITKEKQNQSIQEIHYNITNAIVNTKNMDELFEKLRTELNKILDAKNFFIAFYNEKNGMFNSGIDIDEKDKIETWSAEKSISGFLVNANKRLLLKKNEILELMEKGELTPVGTIPEVWLGVPLKLRNTVIGLMAVQSYENPNAYNKIGIDLFELIGNQLSLYLERNRAKEDTLKLSRAIMQSPISIVITSIDGDIEYVNPMFEKVTQYSFEEVFGENPRLLKSTSQSDEFYKNLWDTVLAGRDWNGEILNKKKNGDLFWEKAIISPIQNDKGKITHFVAIKEDITEKKKMIEELIFSKEQAEVSEKIKTEFLAQMSHEIRSPLNVIMSFIGLIKDEMGDGLSEEMFYSFESINSASSRIIRTIDLILNMTDLQLGSYNLSIAEIDIVLLLKRVKNEYIQSAHKKGLKLDLKLELDNNLINTDEYALMQIVSNLVDNAIKYSEKGYISIIAEKTEENEIVIKVVDTGIGMSESFLPNLFKSFTQEEQGYSRSYDGNGLGMALVKKYCEIISADISVVSEKGKGTTFTIVVPSLIVKKID